MRRTRRWFGPQDPMTTDWMAQAGAEVVHLADGTNMVTHLDTIYRSTDAEPGQGAGPPG